MPLAVVSEMATEKGFKISDPSFGWRLQDFTQHEGENQKKKPGDFCVETCRIIGIEVTKEILESSLQGDKKNIFGSELRDLLFESQETVELKLRKRIAEYIQPDSLEGEILLMLFDKKNYWRCNKKNSSLGALNKKCIAREDDIDHTFKSEINDTAGILFRKIRTIQKGLCEVRRGIQFVKIGLIEEDKRISTLILQCHQIQSEQKQTAYLDDILSLLDSNNMDKLNFHHKWPFRIGANKNGTKNLII